ncbi:MAG: MFS transporter [Myxococcota bacterium]|nr:MFS transporter [Myxococcota bacterium]
MPSQPLSSTRVWAVTLVATATMAISYLDRQVLAALAPAVRADLEIGAEQYGWLASAFSIAYLISTPLAGRALELVGVRRGMLGAVVLWTMVSAGHALVPTFALLFAARLALGVSESPSFPGSAAAIARTVPASGRARALGILYTGSSFGAMVAPVLAPWMMARFGGWRAAFLGVAIVGLLWVPMWLVATGTPTVRAMLDARPAPAERRSLLSTATHPGVLRAGALVLALSPMFAFVLLWGAELLHHAYGVAQVDIGRYLWLPPLLFDLGAVFFGVLASRFAARGDGEGSPIMLSVVALGMALAIGLLPLCRDPWQVTVVLGIAMAGGAGLFAMLTADMIGRVGPALAASAGGVVAAAQSLAYIVANPLIGRAFDALGSYDVVAVVLAAWMLPGSALWLATRGRTPARA